MLRVYEGYERRKEHERAIDFEDMLGLAVRLFDEHPEAAQASGRGSTRSPSTSSRT